MDKDRTIYSLSPRDLTVMRQANVAFHELTGVTPGQPGLPPLWSKMPYLMLVYDQQSTAQAFWKAYREFNDLLKTRDRHYRHSHIQKSSGGTRDLLVPDGELRKHQRFILHHILYRIPVSEYACAYHKHRGLPALARPHTGHDVLLHLDIKDFFSSISEQRIFEVLLQETAYPKAVAGFLARLCCYRHHLPQGACTSPALSNICFKHCDAALAALAERENLAYTRYSDDIFLSGNDIDAGFILNEAIRIISQHGFCVNRHKLKILKRHQSQRVTSIVVNEKMQVSRAYRRRLRQEIYYLKKFKENATAAEAAEDFECYLHQVLGRITFVLHIDPHNREFIEARRMVDEMLCVYKYSRVPIYFSPYS